jgi:hypothetical protein
VSGGGGMQGDKRKSGLGENFFLVDLLLSLFDEVRKPSV